jgi:hypothetical protein
MSAWSPSRGVQRGPAAGPRSLKEAALEVLLALARLQPKATPSTHTQRAHTQLTTAQHTHTAHTHNSQQPRLTPPYQKHTTLHESAGGCVGGLCSCISLSTPPSRFSFPLTLGTSWQLQRGHVACGLGTSPGKYGTRFTSMAPCFTSRAPPQYRRAPHITAFSGEDTSLVACEFRPAPSLQSSAATAYCFSEGVMLAPTAGIARQGRD